jgi:tripartite-type tricarboxylate transporter receptor subunit TctC
MAVRHALILLVLTCFANFRGEPTAAQEYPNRVVRVIVPLAVGGGGDIFARALSEELKMDLGQPFVVENRSGAAEIIGTRACAEAPPDGYTVCVVSQEPIVYNQLLFKSIPYNPETDLVPVVKLFINPAVVAINSARGISTFDEMISSAKAKPGSLSYGTFSFPFEVLMARLNKEHGIDIAKVPFRGGGELANAMLSDATPIGAVGVPNVLPFLETGRFKALAFNGKQRLRMFSNVPTLDELRPGEQYSSSWFGMLAPAATPTPIVEKLANASQAVLVKPTFRDKMFAPRGIVPVDLKLEAFRRFIAEDRAIAIQIVKESGVQPK